MPDFTQATRPLRVALGDVPEDGVLLTGLSGTEAVSGLFSFTLTLVSPAAAPLRFADVLGKPAAVAVDADPGHTRHVHGVICRLRQTHRDHVHSHYQAELVPPLWLLTRATRSRIFQGRTVPEILKEVLAPVYAPAFDLRAEYHPRKTCAQYRESDFAFASRLMEEEGLYYFFTHSGGDHGLVISDHPQGHAATPGDPFVFQADLADQPNEGRVHRWEKCQELRTGAVEQTDHWFELPGNTLWATERVTEAIPAGSEAFDPTAGGMGEVAVVEHPWGGAHWRDGVARGGADQPGDLDHLFADAARIARVRLGQEQSGAVRVEAAGTYARLTAGHRFTLAGHPDADGEYVVLSARHTAACGADRSGDTPFSYANAFDCQPVGLPYRPPRVTPRPAVRGTQTAVVVGDDPEIDPDKYGRVKVWFRWDPAGRRGLDTSCWVRVAQAWAGRRWGTQFVPRVGDEVVVAFLEGDPDQPLIIGSVYNADNMPVFPLPENKTQSGLKTFSSPGGDSQTFNEIKFEDKKGEELVSVHAERNLSVTAELDSTASTGNNHTGTVGTNPKADPRESGKSTTTIFGDTTTTITKGDHSFTVAAGKSDTFVKGAVTQTYDDTLTTTVTNAIAVSSTSSHIHLTSPTEIRLAVGDSTVTIQPSSIVLNSKFIHFEATDTLSGKAPHVKFEGTADVLVTTPKATLHGSNTVDVAGAVVNVTGKSEATMAAGAGAAQAVKCDGGQVAVSGKAITAKADGTHTIRGSLVKIN